MIRRIKIDGFKSIHSVDVELEWLTVLVGRSGSGKSNFIDAIRFVRDLLKGDQKTLAQRYGQNGASVRPAIDSDRGYACTVEFSAPGFDDWFVYSLEIHQRTGWAPLLERLKYGDQIVFEHRILEKRNASAWTVEPRLVSVPKISGIMVGKLPGLELAVVAYISIATGIGLHEFPYDVLCGPFRSDTTGLTDSGDNYLQVMREIGVALHLGDARKEIKASLRQINSTVESIEIDSITNPKNAVVSHKMGDKTMEIPLAGESYGFRRFYAHLLALYQQPPKQTLVFEEPENGIYPGALAVLADEFKAAASTRRGQVILTTHSPGLLDHFAPEDIRAVELVELETRIGRLAEDQVESLRQKLMHAGELLTVDSPRRQGAGEE